MRVIKSCWRWLPAAALGLACLMPDPVARVHAGEVAASLDNGVLTLVGSADPDALLITGGPNIVVVTALGETRFPSMGRRGSRVLTFRDVTGVTFDGLSGDDSLNVFADLASLEFLGGDDHDSLFAVVGAADILHVDAGAGSDNLYVSATAAALTMDLGPDNDAATISNSTLGMLTISDAGGNDTVLLSLVEGLPEEGMALSMSLDDGDDQVVFQRCNIVSPDPMTPALLDGGLEDSDQLGQIESQFTPAPTISEFEIVIGFDPPPPPPPPLRASQRRNRWWE